MPEPSVRRLGPRAVLLGTLGFVATLALAAWPLVDSRGRMLPGSLVQSTTQLWLLRWHERCALEGRSPYFSTDLNYPTGVALDQFPALHFQTLAFVSLRSITTDDAVRFNLIWACGLLTTAMGTAWLAWTMARDRLAAWLAGVFVMLCTLATVGNQGDLELVYLGGFPVFLWAWLRWLEERRWRRLATALVAFLFLTASARQYGLMAAVPALVALGFSAARGVEGVASFFFRRLAGLTAFLAAAAAGLVLLSAGPIWAWLNELSLDPMSPPSADNDGPRASFLTLGGPLALLALGPFVRTGLVRPRHWWTLLAILVALAISGHFPTARFDLFALVIAGVVSAATIRARLDRLPDRRLIGPTAAGLAIVVAAIIPASWHELPLIPPSYSRLAMLDPDATLLELPQPDPSGGRDVGELSAVAAFWQAEHRLRTVAGRTIRSNPAFDGTIGGASPFLDHSLSLGDEAAWLFLETHGIDHVVLHKWFARAHPNIRRPLDRLADRLEGAKLFEDEAVAIYARDRLPRPTRPVVLPTAGWTFRDGENHAGAGLAAEARLAVYVPDGGRPLELALQAVSGDAPRRLWLTTGAGAVVLAEWWIASSSPAVYVSPPFQLPAGHHELSLRTVDDPPVLNETSPQVRVASLTVREARHDGAVLAARPLTSGSTRKVKWTHP